MANIIEMGRNFTLLSYLFSFEFNYLYVMKLIKLLPVLLLSLIVFACIPDVEYRTLAEFDFDENAVSNLEKLELLYVSATPTDQEHLTYFVHAVALMNDSKDTVNVLTPFSRGAGGGSSKNEFKFLTLESEEGKEYFKKLYQDPEAPVQYEFERILKIDRVSYDKRFDYIAKNNFPTVIGFLEK